jgi:hypothetical protein
MMVLQRVRATAAEVASDVRSVFGGGSHGVVRIRTWVRLAFLAHLNPPGRAADQTLEVIPSETSSDKRARARLRSAIVPTE